MTAILSIAFAAGIFLGVSFMKGKASESAAAGYAALFGSGKNVWETQSGYTALDSWKDKRDGVRISVNGSGSYFYRTDIIDLNKLNKNVPLLSFYAERSENSSFTSMRIVLIDADDASNQIAVQIKYEPTAATFCYMVAEFGEYALGINNQYDTTGYGKVREYYGTLLTKSSFTGANDIYPFNFSYDIGENAVYTMLEGNTLTKVLDFDDEEALADYGTWGGFTSGHVYMRVEFGTARKAAVIIQESAGLTFEKENEGAFRPQNSDILRFDFNDGIIDAEDPDVFFDGAVGYSYPLPVPFTRDIIYGDLAVNTEVFFGDENITAEITDGRISTARAGEYKAVYTCTDNYGNTIVKECPFTVADNPSDISISGVENSSARLLTYYTVPEASAAGGNGNVSVRVEVLYNGESVEPDANGRIYLDKKGSLTLKAVAFDKIGQIKEESHAVTIESDVREIKLLSAMPLSVYAMREYVLPDFTATDYSLEPYTSGYNMEKRITVDGRLLGADRKFTAQTGDVGKDVLVVYEAGFRTGQAVSKSFSIRVLPANDMNDVGMEKLFLSGNSLFSASIFDYGAALSFVENTAFGFANYLPASQASVTMEWLDNSSNFSGIRFILEDCTNLSERLEITFEKTESGAEISVNGGVRRAVSVAKGSYALGSMQGVSYRQINFAVDRDAGTVVDAEGNIIYNLTTFVNGDVFNGFSSGLVRLRAEIFGVTDDSEMVISKISNQSFAAAAYSRGDRQGAAIGLEGEIERFPTIGSDIVLPAATAYDVLQGEALSITLSVRSPSGVTVSLEADRSYLFPVNEYGTYAIRYSAMDYFGNEGTHTVQVTVRDMTAPSITVKGSVSESLEKGASIAVPDYVAYDNAGAPEVYIFFENPQTYKKVVSAGETLVFEQTGDYRLIYFTRDAAGNSSVAVFNISVR